MSNTTGLVVGKFAPLHNGHINMINWAATHVDHLYVLMSFDQKWLDKQPTNLQKTLSRNNRLRWLKSTFKDIPHITIVDIDETHCPAYPNGWNDWVPLVLEATEFNKIDMIFGSEPNDASNYDTMFPGSKYLCFDENRSQIDISATKIRAGVFSNWEMLPSIVRADFALKVCVIGTESCGKTTLVKYLAKRFSTAWVEEYGRTFVEHDLCGDESLLEPKHYSYITMRQKMMEYDELKACNRVLFVDTNAVVTAAFLQMYEEADDTIVDAIARSEDYDVILDLSSDVPWIDDGMRTNGSLDQRARARRILNEELMFSGVTPNTPGYHSISGNYTTRLEDSISIVEHYLTK